MDELMTLAVAMLALGQGGGETLYNGITLPEQWPPAQQSLTTDPLPEPPYLASPPDVVQIDVGRQLFVDDFLIEQTTLERTWHAAEYHPASPVLRPDKPWEIDSKFPTAMVFSDGVWFDQADGLFKMWYMGGYCDATCYATSEDGIHWEKPELDVVPGTNIVHAGGRDSSVVWLDLEESDAGRRYKLLRYAREDGWVLRLHFSADGIHWTEPGIACGPSGDRTSMFYNPFRRMWIYSLTVLAEGASWKAGEPPLWV